MVKILNKYEYQSRKPTDNTTYQKNPIVPYLKPPSSPPSPTTLITKGPEDLGQKENKSFE